VAIGTCAGSKPGNDTRMPRARVTTPDAPEPMSSARSKQATWSGRPGATRLSAAGVPARSARPRASVARNPPVAGPKPTQTMSASSSARGGFSFSIFNFPFLNFHFPKKTVVFNSDQYQ